MRQKPYKMSGFNAMFKNYFYNNVNKIIRDELNF